MSLSENLVHLPCYICLRVQIHKERHPEVKAPICHECKDKVLEGWRKDRQLSAAEAMLAEWQQDVKTEPFPRLEVEMPW
jgi:hypothetical protein